MAISGTGSSSFASKPSGTKELDLVGLEQVVERSADPSTVDPPVVIGAGRQLEDLDREQPAVDSAADQNCAVAAVAALEAAVDGSILALSAHTHPPRRARTKGRWGG
jgi:hypothetical protein